MTQIKQTLKKYLYLPIKQIKMKKILFTLNLLVSLFINAQVTFGNQNIIVASNAAGARSVYAADIDGDGDMDMLSASKYDDKIAWYENTDGNGTFGAQQVITTNADGANSVYAADIDGDGDMDVLSASENDDKIAWYENTDGNGTFGAQQVITTNAGGADSVYVADIDGDGDMDVLSASFYDSKIAWYENTDGAGTFGIQQVIDSGEYGTKFVYTSDIDGDGDMDVLLASYYKIAWYENTDGAGTFGVQQVITTSANGAVSVYAADIDGDGDIDVLSASFNDDKIAWYENTDGNGSFSVQQVITTNTDSAYSVFASDIDGDGDMDVLSASDYDGKIAWYENTDGAGTFGTQQIITTNTSGAYSVYAADIDGDGNMDVLSASFFDDKIAWYENTDGTGTFGTQQIITSIGASGAKSVYTADIDGDGDMDVLSASEQDDKIAWYENTDGAGTFSAQQVITTNTNLAKSVYATDIDGDGDMDVLSASALDDKIAWYKNTNGVGTFGAQQIITTNADYAKSVYAADIDGDGDMDVLSASEFDDKIAWYENTDGAGTFGMQQIISTNANGALSVYAADIDGDGDMDVLSASDYDGKIAWYENTNGAGIFGTQQVITTNASGAYSVYAADIDGDGDMDVLSASWNDSKIAWYENTDGAGTFGAQQVITTHASGTYFSVYAADIDGDGDMDILSASKFASKIAWYENTDGIGTFGAQQVISTNADGANSVYAADIDGDGDMDVLSASWGDDKIAWYENLGITTNKITGTITLNISGSCTTILPNIAVNTNNGADSYTTFSLANGLYQLFPQTGNFTTEVVTSSIPNYYTVNPSSYNDNFTNIGNMLTHNFCITPNQTINDINITIIPTGQARPGFNVNYRIIYKNIGTTQLNGDINLEFDNAKLNFLNASETINAQTSNSLTFNYSNLNPFETRTIDLTFNVFSPPTVNIDDVLTFTATINPVANDFTPDDNVYTLNQTVIGSYDPNDITCLEGDEVLLADADKYLHYVIRFQNTGTANALKVEVKNILDANLDWSTLQLESISHNNRVEIKNGNEVSFIFDGINLPDSTTDEPNSHGFIAYKIKPKANIALGDVISNQADIYFDFNQPVTTNMAITTIVNALGVNEFSSLNFSVYPSPVADILHIQTNTEIRKVTIYNKLGQLVFTSKNDKIDISGLTKGVYFVKVEGINGNFGIQKIVKE